MYNKRDGEVLTEPQKERIAKAIFSIFGINWAKQWATLNFDYEPIQNYNMVEQMSDDKTVTDYGRSVTRTDDLTHAKTGTDTETPNLTETRTDDLTHAKTGTDTETPNLTETRTDDLTHAKAGTDTETPNLMETTTPNLTTVTDTGVFGFNSSSVSSPADTQTQKATGNSELSRTGTNQTEYNTQETDTGTQTNVRTGDTKTQYNTQETDTGTQTNVRTGDTKTQYNTQETDTGTQTNVRTGDTKTQYNTQEKDTGTQTMIDGGADSQTRNYTLTRSGNIGVTTSQQMIQSERELWLWHYFLDIVFPDVDKILTLSIY